MIIKLVLTGLLSCCLLPAFTQVPAIGNWREHLPYHQAIGVAGSGEKIWCATPYSLFSVDRADNSMERLSRITGLSETGISAIQYDSQASKLIIAYNSSNIDILSGNQVFNIPDIRQSPVAGSKTVYNILATGNRAYLSTGLGVIVLDEDKYEVKDTWIIGSNGDTVMVNTLATDGSFFYAASSEGLKQADASSSGLPDFHNWSLLSGSSGLPAGPCTDVAVFQGKILALQHDSLFLSAIAGGSPGSWSFFYADGWQLRRLSIAGGKLMVCEQKADSGRVLILTAGAAIERALLQGNVIERPLQALFSGGQYFVADSVGGLSGWGAAVLPERYIPNSPQSLATGEMIIGRQTGGDAGTVHNASLWATAGGVDANWDPLNDRDGLYHLGAEGWTNYNSAIYPSLDSLSDLITVAADPGDKAGSVWAGSFGGGLVHIGADSSFTIYAKNSPVSPVQGQPSIYRVSGLAFDAGRNLWIANFGAANDLLLRKADGNWLSFAIPFPHTQNAVSQIVTDDDNKQVWIVSPLGNGLFCYNHGVSLDNVSDDKWKFFQAGRGNGNLPDNNVNCIARDKSGFIWVGTANGIGLIQCTRTVFSNGGCEAMLPVVQFDNFAGYLFSGEQVQAIAVDGADRKWVGTRNGVWLISPDAQKIVYHFTEENSPLLDNDIRRIAVDPQTGEVFFATASGTCSFRSTATQGGQHNSGVLVFPNPVPPGYTGTIAIRGLVDGAIVKITEMDGRLLYQGRALGGQAVWDGRDYRGRKASTGVYLVLISDDSRQEKAAAKIVFIGK